MSDFVYIGLSMKLCNLFSSLFSLFISSFFLPCCRYSSTHPSTDSLFTTVVIETLCLSLLCLLQDWHWVWSAGPGIHVPAWTIGLRSSSGGESAGFSLQPPRFIRFYLASQEIEAETFRSLAHLSYLESTTDPTATRGISKIFPSAQLLLSDQTT